MSESLAAYPAMSDPSETPSEQSLADQAFERIERLIVTLALPPGHIFSESELSTRIGIGRTPMREALQRLATARMVEAIPRRGMRVVEIDAAEYLDLLATRGVLDRLIAVHAARRASPDERIALESCVDEMGQAALNNDIDAFLLADRKADILLESASHNAAATTAAAPLHVHCRRFWVAHQHHSDLTRSAALHASVIQRVAQGDEEEAGKACDALIAYLTSFARTALDL